MKKSLTNQEKRFAKVHKGAFAHFCKGIMRLFAKKTLSLQAILESCRLRLAESQELQTDKNKIK